MKRNKRFLALGLAMAMVAMSLTGCGGKEETATDASAKNETSKETTTTAPAASADSSAETGERQKLVVGLTQSSMVTDYEDNYFTSYLEDKLNIDIEFYMLPSTAEDSRTKVALMATGQEDLPDVLVMDGHLTNEMILQYGESGFFLPLNDYMNDAELMPNYNAIPAEDRATIDTAITMADGNIYGFPAFEPETWNMTSYRMFINKAWLDKLGLEIPKTTDELKEVLIAFRDGDPNGNGIQDEIGVYGWADGGYGENVTWALMNSFIFYNGGMALAEDGETVMTPYTTDQWREGLRYMNDLYNEGVLSANIFTDDHQQFRAIVNQETPIVGFVSAGSLSTWPDVVNNPNYAEMEFIEPLTGPEGVQYTPFFPYNPGQEMFILSSTDKVDLAIKFADEFFSYETSVIERYGEEGVDWTRDPAVIAEHSNAYIEAGLYDELSLVITSTVWADNQNQTWRNHGPRYASLELGNTTYDFSGGKKFDPADRSQLFGKCYDMYYDKHPEKVLPPLKLTAEETEKNQDALTNIPDYVKQSIAEFVIGDRDINDDAVWAEYLQILDDMGLQGWVEASQAAYDRIK